MLKLENVSKYYYSSSNVCCALRKINLQFKLGEFVAITGESGSGKTTLLNVISGFESYEEGEILFNNEQTSYYDAEDWELYRKNEIAFIFQNYNLIDSYSVLENVMVTYILEGIPYENAKSKSIEILEKVGLSKDINKKTTKLSGGQKQRLAIARALAKEFNETFAQKYKVNCCKVLSAGFDFHSPERKQHCSGMVSDCAVILEDIIKANQNINV